MSRSGLSATEASAGSSFPSGAGPFREGVLGCSRSEGYAVEKSVERAVAISKVHWRWVRRISRYPSPPTTATPARKSMRSRTESVLQNDPTPTCPRSQTAPSGNPRARTLPATRIPRSRKSFPDCRWGPCSFSRSSSELSQSVERDVLLHSPTDRARLGRSKYSRMAAKPTTTKRARARFIRLVHSLGWSQALHMGCPHLSFSGRAA